MASYCIMQGHSKNNNLKLRVKTHISPSLKIEYSPMRWACAPAFSSIKTSIQSPTILILTANRSLCRNFFVGCNGRDTVEAVKTTGAASNFRKNTLVPNKTAAATIIRAASRRAKLTLKELSHPVDDVPPSPLYSCFLSLDRAVVLFSTSCPFEVW